MTSDDLKEKIKSMKVQLVLGWADLTADVSPIRDLDGQLATTPFGKHWPNLRPAKSEIYLPSEPSGGLQ